MSETPKWLKDVQRLQLKPGDAVAIRFAENPSEDDLKMFHQRWRDLLPHVPLILLDAEDEIYVVEKEEGDDDETDG